MKKIILSSTTAAILLLIGGTVASADVTTPESLEIPVTVTPGQAEFTFNEGIVASELQVTSSLFSGTQTGTLSNVGGTLTNLSFDAETVTVHTSSSLEGLVVNGGATISTHAIEENSASVDVDFTINRTAALASASERFITVTAQNSGISDEDNSF